MGDAHTNVVNTLRLFSNMVNAKGTNKHESLYDMPSKLRRMAHFASASYNPKDTLKGYTLDKSLSNKRFSVYTKGKKVILSVRGTADVEDALVDDMQIATGKQHNRVEEAQKKLDEVKAKYGDKRISLVGHSMGALTAGVIGSRNKLHTYAYNPGSSSLGGKEYEKLLKESFDNDYVTTVVKEGDGVSAGMIHHARNENLHIIRNHNKNLKSTVDRHYMSNFLENEHAARIHKHLKENNIDHGAHMERLVGQKDASLKRKAERLVGSGLDVAVNEGPYLGAGGFHAQYTPSSGHHSVSVGKYSVPGRGAGVYVNKKTGVLYGFKSNGDMILLTGSMAEKSKILKTLKGYGEGPTTLMDDSSIPATKSVAMVVNQSGRGYDFIDASSPGSWGQVMSGINRPSLPEYNAGKAGTHGKVGNGAIDIFSQPVATTDDKWVATGEDIGRMLYSNLWTILELGADIATSGAASAVVTATELVLDSTGASDSIQSALDKLMPEDKRNSSLMTTPDIFAGAIGPGNNSVAAFQSADQNIIRDDRIPMQLKANKKRYDKLKKDLGGVLSEENQKRFQAYSGVNLKVSANRDNDYAIAKEMKKNSSKLLHMEQGMGAIEELKNLKGVAVKNKNYGVIQDQAKRIEELFVPQQNTTEDQDRYDLQQVVDTTVKVQNDWDTFVMRKMDFAGTLHDLYHRRALGMDTDKALHLQKSLGDRTEFEKLADEKGLEKSEQNFQTYKEEKYVAYMVATGHDMDWDSTSGFVSDEDKFYVKKGKKYKDAINKVKREAGEVFIGRDHFQDYDLSELKKHEEGFQAKPLERKKDFFGAIMDFAKHPGRSYKTETKKESTGGKFLDLLMAPVSKEWAATKDDLRYSKEMPYTHTTEKRKKHAQIQAEGAAEYKTLMEAKKTHI